MKVSVIIPVYNVEKTLPRCIDSVIGQSLKDIEIILVDDGSPDKSPEICDEYRCKDSRIKVFHKPNEGLGYTRNYGIERAQGEYVAFVDSDDYIASDMLDKLYNTAIKEDADVVYGGYYRVINGEIRQGSHPIQNRIKWRGKEEIKDLLLDCVSSKPEESEDSKYGATCCKGIYKRAILKDNDIRFYSEREVVSEDGLFAIDFLTKANLAVMIPDCLYYYEYNPVSITSSYRPDRFEKNVKLFKIGSKKLLKAYNDDAIVVQYSRMFIAAGRVCVIQEVNNSFSFKEKLFNIKKICSDKDLQMVLLRYPIQKLPVSKFLMAYLMKRKNAILIYLVIKAKYLRH